MIMEPWMMLPPGFCFSPTGEQLINYFLLKKTMGQLLPFEAPFVECDLYGSQSPWQLLNENEQWIETHPGDNTVKCIYVFTTLKYLGKNGKKRMARTAGCGSWHMETGAKPILDKGKVEIGKMEMFTFISNDQTKKGTKGHWIMHEFALSGSALDNIKGRSSKNYVVCKITRDASKDLKVSPASQIKKEAKVENESENNPPQRVHVNYEFSRRFGSGSLTSMKPITPMSLSSLAPSSSRCEESDPSTSLKENLDPFEMEEIVTQEASQHEYDGALETAPPSQEYCVNLEENNNGYIYGHEEGNAASGTSEPMFSIEKLLMSLEKGKEDGAQETVMLPECCANPEIAYSLSSLASSSSRYEESDPCMNQKQYIDPFEIEEDVTQETSQHEEHVECLENEMLEEDGAQEATPPNQEEGNAASGTSELLMSLEKVIEDGSQETVMLPECCANPEIAYSLSSLLASSSSRYEESDPCMNQKQYIDPFEIKRDVTQESSQHEEDGAQETTPPSQEYCTNLVENNNCYIYGHDEDNAALGTSQPMSNIEELLISLEKNKEDCAQETVMLQERCANPEIAYSLSSLASSSSTYEESDPCTNQKQNIDPFEVEEYVTQESSQHEEDGAQKSAPPSQEYSVNFKENNTRIYEHEEGIVVSGTSEFTLDKEAPQHESRTPPVQESFADFEEDVELFEKVFPEEDGAQEAAILEEYCTNLEISCSGASKLMGEVDEFLKNMKDDTSSLNANLAVDHKSENEGALECYKHSEPSTTLYECVQDEQGVSIKRSSPTADLGINSKKARYSDVTEPTSTVMDTCVFPWFFDPDDIWGHNMGLNSRFMGNCSMVP